MNLKKGLKNLLRLTSDALKNNNLNIRSINIKDLAKKQHQINIFIETFMNNSNGNKIIT